MARFGENVKYWYVLDLTEFIDTMSRIRDISLLLITCYLLLTTALAAAGKR